MKIEYNVRRTMGTGGKSFRYPTNAVVRTALENFNGHVVITDTDYRAFELLGHELIQVE